MIRLASVLGVTSICVLLSGCALEQARRDYLVLNNKLPHSHMGNNRGDVYSRGGMPITLPSKIIDEIVKKSEEGDALAMSQLGQLYLLGQGVEKNVEEGVRLTLASAEKGWVSAQHNIAWLYENGTGLEQSWEKAIYWYEQAAQQKKASSLNNLGRIYDNGFGVEEDKIRAFEYYLLAADRLSPLGQHNVGLSFLEGVQGEKNREKAKLYFESACLQKFRPSCDALKGLE